MVVRRIRIADTGVRFPHGPPFALRVHFELRSGKPHNYAGIVWIVLKKGVPNEAVGEVGCNLLK